MFKAWVQLVRLPNVFTAPADVIAGAALGYHAIGDSVLPSNIVILCLISVCYYSAGMILNDVADLEQDRQERAFRPLPSGRIHKSTASCIGFGLLLLGLGIGITQLPTEKPWWQCWPLFVLPVLILAYNFWLKQTWFGPLTMGLCRGCNLLLGTLMMTDVSPFCYFGAIITTLYITGITVIAFDETREIQRQRMKTGITIIFFSTVLLSFLVPVSLNWKGGFDYLPYAGTLVIVLILLLLYLWLSAFNSSSPALMGRAIKYSILGLIIIDSVYTTIGIGYLGLLLLLLLIPAMFLGKFIYST